MIQDVRFWESSAEGLLNFMPLDVGKTFPEVIDFAQNLDVLTDKFNSRQDHDYKEMKKSYESLLGSILPILLSEGIKKLETISPESITQEMSLSTEDSVKNLERKCLRVLYAIKEQYRMSPYRPSLANHHQIPAWPKKPQGTVLEEKSDDPPTRKSTGASQDDNPLLRPAEGLVDPIKPVVIDRAGFLDAINWPKFAALNFTADNGNGVGDANGKIEDFALNLFKGLSDDSISVGDMYLRIYSDIVAYVVAKHGGYLIASAYGAFRSFVHQHPNLEPAEKVLVEQIYDRIAEDVKGSVVNGEDKFVQWYALLFLLDKRPIALVWKLYQDFLVKKNPPLVKPETGLVTFVTLPVSGGGDLEYVYSKFVARVVAEDAEQNQKLDLDGFKGRLELFGFSPAALNSCELIYGQIRAHAEAGSKLVYGDFFDWLMEQGWGNADTLARVFANLYFLFVEFALVFPYEQFHDAIYMHLDRIQGQSVLDSANMMIEQFGAYLKGLPGFDAEKQQAFLEIYSRLMQGIVENEKPDSKEIPDPHDFFSSWYFAQFSDYDREFEDGRGFCDALDAYWTFLESIPKPGPRYTAEKPLSLDRRPRSSLDVTPKEPGPRYTAEKPLSLDRRPRPSLDVTPKSEVSPRATLSTDPSSWGSLSRGSSWPSGKTPNVHITSPPPYLPSVPKFDLDKNKIMEIWKKYRQLYQAFREFLNNRAGRGDYEMVQQIFADFLAGAVHIPMVEKKVDMDVFKMMRFPWYKTALNAVGLSSEFEQFYRGYKVGRSPPALLADIQKSYRAFDDCVNQWQVSHHTGGESNVVNVVSGEEGDQERGGTTIVDAISRAPRKISNGAVTKFKAGWLKLDKSGRRFNVDQGLQTYATEGNPNLGCLCTRIMIEVAVFLFILFVSCVWFAQQIYSPTIQFYTYYPLAMALGAHFAAVATQRAMPFIYCELIFVVLGFIMAIMYCAEFAAITPVGGPFTDLVNGNSTYSHIAPGLVRNATIIMVTDTVGTAQVDFVNLNIVAVVLAMVWYLVQFGASIWALVAVGNDARARGFKKAQIYTPITILYAEDTDKLRLAASFLSMFGLLFLFFEVVISFMAQLGSVIIPSVFNMPDFFLAMMFVIAIMPPPPGVPFPEQDDYDAVLQAQTYRADRLLSYDEIMDIIMGYEYYLLDKDGRRLVDEKSDEMGVRRQEANPAKAINIIWAQCAYENFQLRSPARNEMLARQLGRVTIEYILFVVGLGLAVLTSVLQNTTSWSWRADNSIQAVCTVPTDFAGIVVSSTQIGFELSYWSGALTVSFFHDVDHGTFSSGFYQTITCADDWVRISIFTIGFVVFVLHLAVLFISLTRYGDLKYGVTHPQEGKIEKLLTQLNAMFSNHSSQSPYFRDLVAPQEEDDGSKQNYGNKKPFVVNVASPQDEGGEEGVGLISSNNGRWNKKGYGIRGNFSTRKPKLSASVDDDENVGDELRNIENRMLDTPLLNAVAKEHEERMHLKGY